MIVSDQQADKALVYLSTTDMEVADWRVAVLRLEYLIEVTEAMVYKSLEGSVEDRKRGAKASKEVEVKMEEYFKAVREWEIVKARRKRAELTVEVWRSANASRRVGNI